MRILQISSAKTFGGGERHLVDLCRGLQNRGHDVFVALRPTSDWQNRLDFLPPENFLQVSIRNSFGVFSAKRIAGFIRDNDIEIVHAHVARDYIPASIACLAANKPKFVLTRHVLFPLKPFNKFALKNLSRAIGVSDAVGEGLAKIFAPSKVSVISKGIDLDHYANGDEDDLNKEFRSFHQIPFDAPLVGTLGELKELKGQRDFVLAAHEILKEFPDCRFVVAGKDNTADRSFRREIKRLAGVLGMNDRFFWLDWLDDTSPFFAAIDVFVSPSHSESFGLAILEAMAHGRAVVATDTEGAKAITGGKGVLVPVKDPIRLAEGVAEMLRHPAKREESGAALKQFAAVRFSLTRMVDETVSLYNEILSS